MGQKIEEQKMYSAITNLNKFCVLHKKQLIKYSDREVPMKKWFLQTQFSLEYVIFQIKQC